MRPGSVTASGEPERGSLRRPFDWQISRPRETLTVEGRRLPTIMDCGNDVGGKHRQAQQQIEVLERVAVGGGDAAERPIAGSGFDRVARGKRIGQQLDQRGIGTGLQSAIGCRKQQPKFLSSPKPDGR